MEQGFWIKRWEDNNIAFHEGAPNSMLAAHFDQLSVAKGARVFVPLCGKTRDICWLLSKGYKVVGVELAETAIEQLFSELGVEAEISKADSFTLYHAEDLKIFVGDFFKLRGDLLGEIAAVYDRGSLVAFPEEFRSRYASHLASISQSADQFLLSYQYDASKVQGPPFPLDYSKIAALYKNTHQLSLLERRPVNGNFKKRCEKQGVMDATESAWLLAKL